MGHVRFYPSVPEFFLVVALTVPLARTSGPGSGWSLPVPPSAAPSTYSSYRHELVLFLFDSFLRKALFESVFPSPHPRQIFFSHTAFSDYVIARFLRGCSKCAKPFSCVLCLSVPSSPVRPNPPELRCPPFFWPAPLHPPRTSRAASHSSLTLSLFSRATHPSPVVSHVISYMHACLMQNTRLSERSTHSDTTRTAETQTSHGLVFERTGFSLRISIIFSVPPPPLRPFHFALPHNCVTPRRNPVVFSPPHPCVSDRSLLRTLFLPPPNRSAFSPESRL